MNGIFQTVELDITHTEDVLQSIQDAITQIPDRLQIEPPVKLQLIAAIEYYTVNGENLTVHVSTTQQALNSFIELDYKWADEMMLNFEYAAETAKMRGSG